MIICFVPVKKTSRRCPGKNTKPFAGFEGGMVELKLRQLLKVKAIDLIMVSTDDPDVVNIMTSLSGESLSNQKKLWVSARPDYLCQDDTNADDLIKYAAEKCTMKETRFRPADHVMWAHVTSPLMQADSYELAIASYLAFQDEHDSLLTGSWFKNFLLTPGGLVSNNPTSLTWPRTQDLTHYFQPNHAMFISPREMQLSGRRVGHKPYLYQVDKLSCMDVDEPDDFDMAERLYKSFYGNGLVP